MKTLITSLIMIAVALSIHAQIGQTDTRFSSNYGKPLELGTPSRYDDTFRGDYKKDGMNISVTFNKSSRQAVYVSYSGIKSELQEEILKANSSGRTWKNSSVKGYKIRSDKKVIALVNGNSITFYDVKYYFQKKRSNDDNELMRELGISKDRIDRKHSL